MKLKSQKKQTKKYFIINYLKSKIGLRELNKKTNITSAGNFKITLN